jgi:hypothetical protein
MRPGHAREGRPSSLSSGLSAAFAAFGVAIGCGGRGLEAGNPDGSVEGGQHLADASPEPDASAADSLVADSASDAPGDGTLPGDGAGACPTGKIGFTQQIGCREVGYEFCIPSAAACSDCLAMTVAIVPDATYNGGMGRAGCDLTTQRLYLVPTDNTNRCQTPGGAMTDAAWAQVCAVASLPFVPEVVFTIFP